jgi:hypothetical protein
LLSQQKQAEETQEKNFLGTSGSLKGVSPRRPIQNIKIEVLDIGHLAANS